MTQYIPVLVHLEDEGNQLLRNICTYIKIQIVSDPKTDISS